MQTERGPVVLLAPTPQGWGETAFGVHLGKELVKSGRAVKALISQATAPLFQGSGIAVTALTEATTPFLGLLLDDLIKTARPSAVVLCDLVTSVRALKHVRMTPEALLGRGVPVVGVDTWNSARAGNGMDIFGAETLDAEAWIERLPRRLMPVPFLNPDAGPGACRFLPETGRPAAAVRRHIRRELGIGAGEKLVLLCTSPWQHGPFANPDGNRLVAAAPRLISEYLAELGPAVRLVHVGPKRFEGLALAAGQYQWMPSQRADIFELLLGSADLFLSLNVSAVSTIRAVAAGLPVAVFGNSSRAQTREEAEAFVGGPLHPAVIRHAADLLPLYPFRLWPLGLSSYLGPTLAGNPFLQTLRSLELLDGGRAVETLRELLFSPAAIGALRRSQDDYKNRLARLPSPAAALDAIISDTPVSQENYEAAQHSSH
jgi:hypothetical protein